MSVTILYVCPRQILLLRSEEQGEILLFYFSPLAGIEQRYEQCKFRVMLYSTVLPRY